MNSCPGITGGSTYLGWSLSPAHENREHSWNGKHRSRGSCAGGNWACSPFPLPFTNPIPSWLTGLINYQLCWGNHKMVNIILHKIQSGGRLALGVNEALLWGSCVIGVSLSEPHTSETALRLCVAILVCLWPMHDYCQSAALATRSKAYWSRSNFWFVHLWTINGRLLTGSTKQQSQMPEIKLIISL